MTDKSRYVILVFFVVFACSSASFWPDNQDGVNYLLGIDQYDVPFHQPHFPGYPVYIAVGKLLTGFFSSPEHACVYFSVISGVVCLLFFGKIIRQHYDSRTALICTLFLAVHPVYFEFSHKIFTEIPALALLVSAIAALGNPNRAKSGRWFFSSFILGVMLGIRLSWWPFALFYIIIAVRQKKTASAFCGVLSGVLLWLVPQAIVVGVEDLFVTGFSFTYGHFEKWGGAIGSDSEAENRILLLAIRVCEVLGWWSNGTSLPRLFWTIFSISGICFLVVPIVSDREFPDRIRNRFDSNAQIRTFQLATLLYLAWVVPGQNPEKVRHLLPLIPIFILTIARFIEKYHKAATVTALLFSFTLPINYLSRVHNTPPAVRFRNWVNSLPQNNMAFYCGNSERFFDRYSSKQRVKNVVSMKEINFVLASTWPQPSVSYICNDISGFQESQEAAMIFPGRKGDPVDRTLTLYATQPKYL